MKAYLKLDFKRWTRNIRVTVWGVGKATLTDKASCPVGSRELGQNYPGDCDNCGAFMGLKDDRGVTNPQWGDSFPACCWLLVEREAVEG